MQNTGLPEIRFKDQDFRDECFAYIGERLLEFVTNPANARHLATSPEETMRLFATKHRLCIRDRRSFIARIGQDYRLNWREIEQLQNHLLIL